MAQATLVVPDISCEHCEHAITSALTPVTGVRSVRVDIPERLVRLDYDEAAVSLDQVKEILAEEDYPVESIA
jgi:copper chaperone CopZ